jgi:uncharacterized protein (TIGR00645 family)
MASARWRAVPCVSTRHARSSRARVVCLHPPLATSQEPAIPTEPHRPLSTPERLIDGIVIASRYLLVVFYLGLVLALAVYALVFARFIWDLGRQAIAAPGVNVLAALATMLQLIDAALVASLTIMVIFSNYENFVGRPISQASSPVSWLGRLDPSSLKIKIATTIITISSIYMLKVFIDLEDYGDDRQITWRLIICGFFVVAGLALVAIDRFAGRDEKPDVPRAE